MTKPLRFWEVFGTVRHDHRIRPRQTDDQSLDGQLDALKAAGAERIFADKITGTARSRPELDRLLDQLRQGDVITVTKYDRLARSLRDLLDIVDTIQAQGAGFRSLAEDIDTTTPAGRLVFHVFASIAQFERERISERTKEGLEAARKRGRGGGRPPALSAAQKARGDAGCGTKNCGPCPRSRSSSGSVRRVKTDWG
jgi:DNA invertase Pin-like site-specific DNA recombinase